MSNAKKGMEALMGAIASATAKNGANAPEGTIDRVEMSDDGDPENLLLQLAATIIAEISCSKRANIETQLDTEICGGTATATFQISCTLVRVTAPDGTVTVAGRPKSGDLN